MLAFMEGKGKGMEAGATETFIRSIFWDILDQLSFMFSKSNPMSLNS